MQGGKPCKKRRVQGGKPCERRRVQGEKLCKKHRVQGERPCKKHWVQGEKPCKKHRVAEQEALKGTPEWAETGEEHWCGELSEVPKAFFSFNPTGAASSALRAGRPKRNGNRKGA